MIVRLFNSSLHVKINHAESEDKFLKKAERNMQKLLPENC